MESLEDETGKYQGSHAEMREVAETADICGGSEVLQGCWRCTITMAKCNVGSAMLAP